jgi:hypothetical protein
MNKILLGLLAGAVLGAIDGATAWFTPAVRSELVGIIFGSTVKGIIAGVAASESALCWPSWSPTCSMATTLKSSCPEALWAPWWAGPRSATEHPPQAQLPRASTRHK